VDKDNSNPESAKSSDNSAYVSYRGQYLISTPAMGDPRFHQTVIFLCAHDASGAMGLVINKAKSNLVISDLLDHVGVNGAVRVADSPVLKAVPSKLIGALCYIPPIGSAMIIH
jgi:putative AlgH/UPF0301 family transcriptional regulator